MRAREMFPKPSKEVEDEEESQAECVHFSDDDNMIDKEHYLAFNGDSNDVIKEYDEVALDSDFEYISTIDNKDFVD